MATHFLTPLSYICVPLTIILNVLGKWDFPSKGEFLF